MNPGARFRPEPGIFAYDNPKIQSLCPLEKCPAATNGAKPAKSIQPKNRPNAKAAPHTRPGIVKSPRKAKRNRELSVLPIFPYLCRVFLPRIAQHGILTAAPGKPGAVLLLPVVRIPRPDLGGQFRPILAHIIVHVQFAVKAGFKLVTGHRFRV